MGYVIVPWFGYQFCIPHFKFEFLCRTFGPWFFWQFNQTWLAQIWRPEASTSVFWKGTQKHGRGKWQGKTSMDSEVRSCWERFQDIYIIFNAMKLLSYKIDFCIAFAARYWNYQFWRETFSEMCKNSNSITWSDICKLYTKLCHLSRILQESTTCDIYISESFQPASAHPQKLHALRWLCAGNLAWSLLSSFWHCSMPSSWCLLFSSLLQRVPRKSGVQNQLKFPLNI